MNSIMRNFLNDRRKEDDLWNAITDVMIAKMKEVVITMSEDRMVE